MSDIEQGIDLELDADGDLRLDTDFHLTLGIDAVIQGVRIRLLLFRGEWFLDLDEGVPWLERAGVVDASEAILGQKFNETKALNAIRAAIAAAPGVIEVPSLAVSFDGATRIMAVTWQVRTDLELSDVQSTEVG